MRAALLTRRGPPERAFVIRELPDPVPSPGQVRIAVECFGLNFADAMARIGIYREAPPLPAVLGYDVVGRIDALGPDIGNLRVGERVAAMTRFGGYATKALSSRFGVVPLPGSIGAAEGTALATQYVTAWHVATEQTTLHPGDRVLIHAAAGGVGTALVQIARWRGCFVAGTTGSPGKLEHLRSIGVDAPLCTGERGFEQACLDASGGKRFDVIFDSLGGGNFRRSYGLLRPGGRLIGLGIAGMMGARGSLARSLAQAAAFGLYHPFSFLSTSRGIIGVNLLRIADAHPEVILRCLTEVVRMTDAGILKPFVGARLPVSRLVEAHRAMSDRATIGKIAVYWDETSVEPVPRSAGLNRDS